MPDEQDSGHAHSATRRRAVIAVSLALAIGFAVASILDSSLRPAFMVGAAFALGQGVFMLVLR
jgi:hypothetical protein